MTESEFLQAADVVFQHIMAVLDAAGSDIEPILNDSVLTLECPDGSQVIVNRHAANREIWLAGRSGAYHCRWTGQDWRSTREDQPLSALLAQLLSQQSGESLAF